MGRPGRGNPVPDRGWDSTEAGGEGREGRRRVELTTRKAAVKDAVVGATWGTRVGEGGEGKTSDLGLELCPPAALPEGCMPERTSQGCGGIRGPGADPTADTHYPAFHIRQNQKAQFLTLLSIVNIFQLLQGQ